MDFGWQGGFRDLKVALGPRKINEIRQPTLVIQGTDDKVWHFKNAGVLLKSIIGSNLIIMEGIGHELHVADWDLVTDRISCTISYTNV